MPYRDDRDAPADAVRRRVRVLAFVLAGALTSVGVALGVLAFRGARDAPVAPSPPQLPTSWGPPLQLELDSPPGWTSTTEGQWTQLASPDGKARILFTYAIGGAGAAPARYEAWNRLCPSGAAFEGTPREIGPDRLPAFYYEAPCTGEAASLVAVDVQSYRVVFGPQGVVNTSEARSGLNHVVLVSRLASDCPESRRLELASMIASIRRKR